MSQQRKRERTLLWLVLGIFAVLVLNLTVYTARIDLTSNGAWSISKATKDVLAQAQDSVTITYFLSKKLTKYYPFTQDVSDFLDQYASADPARVRVSVVDPQSAGRLGDMQRLGLQPIPINIVEQAQQTQAVVYSGILLQYQDRQDVLPAVSQVDTLEYDLTTKIQKLITQKTRTVAFLSADPGKSLQKDYTQLSQLLTNTVTFREVQPGQPIGDADVLVIAGSKGFSQADLKPVDDYLMKGGKLFVAADGVFVDISSQGAGVTTDKENALNKALETWGVRVEPEMVNDVYNNIVQFRGPQGVELRRYSEWPQILPQDTSPKHPLTSHFGGLSLMWASPLTDLKKPGIQVEPLVWTSPKSWTIKDHLSIDADQALQSAMMPGVKTGKQDEVVVLTGEFPSLFPGGGTSPKTRIVVTGGSSFMTDLMRVIGTSENADFVSNAVDWLSQDEAMLSIKTRATRDKSLTLLQDEQTRQTAAFSLSFVNLFVVPGLVVAWAIVRMMRRRSRENKN